MFMKDELVIYQGEQYTILWVYENQQCELQKVDDCHTVVLSHLSEVEFVELAAI
ncbi:hypothetical protein [Scopulibacillus cellulosilyticus]|uniref:YolD-like protein n=1 Tax=Scopulibacillus cellulosilyticus TaxID=2665665 RepID=A0ABW2PYX1_9BACL